MKEKRAQKEVKQIDSETFPSTNLVA